ncbi:MAG TPA: hypothetical protein VGC54_10145 [Planctomycetota bacterium]
MASGGSCSVLRGLLVLGAALIGLSIYGKLTLKGSLDKDVDAAEDRPYATMPVLGPGNSDALTERLMKPLPSLAVRAVDLGGEALLGAAIHADGPLGRTLDAVGEEEWPEVALGE